jgi:hypothetical protein
LIAAAGAAAAVMLHCAAQALLLHQSTGWLNWAALCCWFSTAVAVVQAMH